MAKCPKRKEKFKKNKDGKTGKSSKYKKEPTKEEQPQEEDTHENKGLSTNSENEGDQEDFPNGDE